MKGPFGVLFCFTGGRKIMTDGQSRIAVIGIIIENREKADQVNGLLHQYGEYIIGRMGIPYKEKQVNIISVVLDAPADIISALAGKLGRIPDVRSKAIYSKEKKIQREPGPKGGASGTADRK